MPHIPKLDQSHQLVKIDFYMKETGSCFYFIKAKLSVLYVSKEERFELTLQEPLVSWIL